MSVIDEIADERTRQREKEGWDDAHDDDHIEGALANAAACYAANTPIFKAEEHAGTGYAPYTAYLPLWPFSDGWWKPKDRRRDLIRAGALIVAEIEAMDRAAPQLCHGSERTMK